MVYDEHVNSLEPGWSRITEHDEFKSDLQFVCALTDFYVNINKPGLVEVNKHKCIRLSSPVTTTTNASMTNMH